MSSKVVGALMIAAVIGTAIFLVKFVPLYIGAQQLEDYFNDCMSNYQQYGAELCRIDMKKIINENKLNLNPDSIVINCTVKQPSTISADWDETLDFFGYKYVHHFHRFLNATVPDKR